MGGGKLPRWKWGRSKAPQGPLLLQQNSRLGCGESGWFGALQTRPGVMDAHPSRLPARTGEEGLILRVEPASFAL
jgi:hypothetical protein